MTTTALPRFAAVAVIAGAIAAAGTVEAGGPGGAVQQAVTWDQVATIRGAAERIGRLHRAKGAKAAYELIDNCYKTHSISDTYGEGFEICITQDYLETRTLMQVYARMPPETLEKFGVPSPQQLATSMGQRISAAFRHYKKPQAYADELKRLVDMHGFPVFLAIVFPEAVRAMEGKTKEKTKEKKQSR